MALVLISLVAMGLVALNFQTAARAAQVKRLGVMLKLDFQRAVLQRHMKSDG